jgi:hypothetical protein
MLLDSGSGMKKKSGSRINILDPQHCITAIKNHSAFFPEDNEEDFTFMKFQIFFNKNVTA